mgnify:CR=1 FL=1|jgi:transcriptional regulator with XRE-family HTH domain|nr:MAG TPA: hypothetical protein [Caudovirales sp. ctNII2]
MEMYERLKYFRKKVKKMTQAEFAEKINLSRSNLGNIETGRISLTDRVISDLCQTFGLSKEWIMSGDGPMYSESDGSIVDQLIIQYNMNDIEARALKFLLNMPEEKRQLVAKAFFAVLDEVKKPGKKYDFPSPDAMVAESSKAYPDFTDGGDKT